MFDFDKCLIDNWSLQRAAFLTDGDEVEFYKRQDLFVSALGGLSNFINAILLYDDRMFLLNGNQTAWTEVSWFKKNVEHYIKPVIMDEEEILLNLAKLNMGHSANYYLAVSKYLDADLFISTERATKIMAEPIPKLDKPTIRVLNEIDRLIETESNKTWSEVTRIGVQNNFIFPSLTHYVLSQATSINDLLRVIFDIKESGIITGFKEKLKELSTDLKDFSKFQLQVEALVKSHLGYPNKKESPFSIKLSVLFFDYRQSVNLNPRRMKYLTFLKDIVSCRTEAFGLRKDVERIFGYNLFPPV